MRERFGVQVKRIAGLLVTPIAIHFSPYQSFRALPSLQVTYGTMRGLVFVSADAVGVAYGCDGLPLRCDLRCHS